MFLNPLMLAGIGAAVIPLVLHLLSKSRYRTIHWGAAMFLQAGAPHQRQSTRLKQILLLSMRMLLIALPATPPARPMPPTGRNDPSPTGPKPLVIPLDIPASMPFEETGRSRLELAREAVFQTLAGLKQGAQAPLILSGDPAGPGDTNP